MQAAKSIYLFIFDTLSDWEIGYVTAGISNPWMQLNPNRYQIKTFSIDGEAIRTIGGLKVLPDMSINEVNADDATMLILAGGSIWEEENNSQIANLATNFHKRKIKIAAICGATYGLAKIGLLDSVKHTSNSKDYILNSSYAGCQNYLDQPSVIDNGFITASGIAPIEFARDIFHELNLYKPETLKAWYKLNKTSSSSVFAELLKTLEA